LATATNDRSSTIGPTILGSIRRFYRIVVLTTAMAFVAGLIWIAVSPSEYAGTVGIIISPPPASLSAGLNTTHVSAATYTGQQVALIQSAPVAAGAANIVNARFSGSHVSGPQIQSGTVVKLPVPGTVGSNGAATRVTVTLPSSTLAPAAANALIASYLTANRALIRSQARNSIAAINAAIARTEAGLSALPPASGPQKTTTSSTTTTTQPHIAVTKPPATTTTRPPRTTTTRPPRTTTTRPPPSTTTTTANSTSTTTTTAAAAAHDVQPQASVDLAAFSATATRGVLVADTTATTATSGATATTTTVPAPSSSGGSSSDSSSSSSSTSGSSTNQQRAALQATLASLNHSKAQVQVNEQVDLAYSPTIFAATAPGVAANGNYLRTLFISMVIGLFIGAIIAFILASSRRRFETATDPQKVYGVPLMTTVPAFEAMVWSAATLPVLTAPTDEAAESYRILATLLRARRGNSDCMVVAFSAADLSSGTTTTVANCGLALAEMGERVLVIDGDPLGRGLTQALVVDTDGMGTGLPPLGLPELLEGRNLAETMVPALGTTDLMVVPSGRDTDMAIHRWRSGTMRTALENLSERFDVILIDTPPMGTSSFSLDLAGVAEHLVLVIPHYDLIELHQGIARRLAMVGVELLGYVYNGTTSSIRFAPYFPIVRGAAAAPLDRGASPISSSASPLAPPPPEPNPSAVSNGAEEPHTATVATVTREEEAETGQVPVVNTYNDDTGVVQVSAPTDDD
jgi:Mrp family chromosome partitioning ATPase